MQAIGLCTMRFYWSLFLLVFATSALAESLTKSQSETIISKGEILHRERGKGVVKVEMLVSYKGNLYWCRVAPYASNSKEFVVATCIDTKQ